jgi:hypothetical protein
MSEAIHDEKVRGKTLRFWTNLGLANAIVIGMAVIWFHGGTLTTGIAWGGASLAMGGMLGFLFGIPGHVQNTGMVQPPKAPEAPLAAGTPPADPGKTPIPSDPPSNLEQVSDWVTKLLLGGGLTQLQQIPTMVWNLAHSVAIGIDSTAKDANLQAQQAFAAGLLIYFFITGFFSGYLITKLQFGRKIL